MKTMIYFFMLMIFVGFINTIQANGISESDPRFEVVKSVFDNLIEAKGVKNMPTPKLVLADSERNVAWSNFKKVEIGIEKKAYEICRSFGKDSLNAMAAILSHELIHYYEKHGWVEMFVKENETHEMANGQPHIDDHIKMETQADYLGGFLAYEAGYNTLEIMPEFLTKVYKEYNLNPEMKGYPSLESRKSMAKSSLQKSKKLIDIYDFANYLSALGEFKKATKYYKYILKDYQSREIYNNLGVLQLAEFVDLCSNKDIQYVYPFEMDLTTRLNTIKKGGSTDFALIAKRKKELLDQANKYFKTAITLDEDYAISFLNQACTFALSGEYDDAIYFVNKTKKLAGSQSKILADSYILLGIIASTSETGTSSIEYFEKAEQLGSSLAKINIDISNGEKIEQLKFSSINSIIKPKEEIGAFSLDKCVVDLKRERLTPTYTIEIDNNTVFATLEKNTSSLFIHLELSSDEYIILQVTKKDYKDSTNSGIYLNESIENIFSKYGNQFSRIQNSNGEFLHYPKSQIAFILNAKKELQQWILYRRSD